MTERAEHCMTHKVAFLDVMDAKVQAEIQSALPPGFSIRYAESGDRREHLAMVADADFILTAVAVDAEMIRAAPKLKLLHKWGIGVDKFDLDAARAARVPVAITGGANAGAVSEHTVMLMLAAYRCRIAGCARANGSARRSARRPTSFPARLSDCWGSEMSGAWSRTGSPVST
jgi:phosphoglycerate dehydrogenase-like enzyme